MKDEVLNLALDALKSAAAELYRASSYCNTYEVIGNTNDAITAIQKAFAAPVQQEPVAWGVIASNTGRICQVELNADEVEGHNPKHIVPLYTTPPAQPAPVQEPSFSEGWERRKVIGFDALVEALDYAERKGFMPDYIADAWEGFNYLVDEKHTPPAAQRQWVGLTEDESDEIFNNWPTYNLDHFEFAQVAVAKVFEKNLTTKVTVPDALNPKDENPAYAAGWNDCRAEMLKGNTP